LFLKILTGLPQKFSDLGPSQWWVATLGGLQTVRDIHHIAGVIMLSDGVYHVGYLGYRIGIQRRLECFKMLPTFQDVRDGGQMVLYFLGLAKQKPRFGRFSYLEKFDYWAVFWGIVVIGGSGLVLMFAVPVSSVLPGQAVTVARTLHSDEAMLAVGWILVVHMFNVHLAPWVFPFNPAIFTGKMSESRYVEDHPLEWARLEAAASAPQTPQAGPAPRRWSRAAATVRSASRRVLARAGQLRRVAVTAVGTGTRRVVVRVRERFAR
jgi:cytochrome b subunit of formate dehydrogenase